jgi:hypothetical protein
MAHTSPKGHVGQLIVPPQPSGATPHALPHACATVSGWHAQTLLLQVKPVAQLPPSPPHVTVPPQPSGMVPQFSGAGQAVSGTHVQTLSVHVSPVGQVPASLPQVSVGQPATPGLNVPQLSPSGHDVGQPVMHCVPLALHTVPDGQVPQLIVPLQPSGAVPQIWPAGQVVIGRHPGHMLLMHVSPGGQIPHVSVPPQPSEMVPQLSPAGQAVSGLQMQLLLVQVPNGHVPQLSVPPQPSGIVAQVTPAAAQVVGTQPQTFGVPPPPQVCGAAQAPPSVPQVSVPPQPSGMVPQL